MKLKIKNDIGTLLNELQLTGNGLEVGVLKGEFSKIILEKWKGTLYMLDSWRHLENYDDANNPDTETHLKSLREAIKNVEPFVDRAYIIRMLSEDAANMLFRDEYFDFIYIDANHSYEGAKGDFEMWYPKLKPGGLFMCDDYIPHDGPIWITWPEEMKKEPVYAGDYGVKKAVNEFVENHKIHRMYITDEPYWRQCYWIKEFK